jgi:predicted acylesterase/phospholipase RssA
MMSASNSSESDEVLKPLDPNAEPPIDRFCDIVLEGGVINGVLYPGFLIELARKFRFRSIGGTSVGAIAAALAAACEYNRRYQGNNGFNEGLAKMPAELAAWVDESKQITKIRSLFQPDRKMQRFFDWFVDVVGTPLRRIEKQEEARKAGAEASPKPSPHAETTKQPTVSTKQFPYLLKEAVVQGVIHFSPRSWGFLAWYLVAVFVVWLVQPRYPLTQIILGVLIFLCGIIIVHPISVFIKQLCTLKSLPGNGMCKGMRASDSNPQGLSEWLYEGVQKAANLPLYKPLTFADLWSAPCGPKAADGSQASRSIDLRMITTCLSHSRIYELPLSENEHVLMFKLSELEPYFNEHVMAHLRRVSKPMSIDTCELLQKKFARRIKEKFPTPTYFLPTDDQRKFFEVFAKTKENLLKEFRKPENIEKGFSEPDLREFPKADLPIVVAARLSMSVPILFQNIPLIGFNLDEHPENIDLVRLWFSDGGIGSNLPVHLFDKPIPHWPTFALKILDTPPRNCANGEPMKAYMPYSHTDGADDNLLYPKDKTEFLNLKRTGSLETFSKIMFSIYTSAKDGHDQSFLRMPDVRNRLVTVYMDNRAGNMLNLKISPKKIKELAKDVGAYGGKLAVNAYLADAPPNKYSWVNNWQDHRWVRFNMLTKGLRSYLEGFTHATNFEALPDTSNSNTLVEQIVQSTQDPPLRSRSDPSDEMTLTPAQSRQLLDIISAISALETQLQTLDLPLPYTPEPMPELRFKPRY